VFYDLEGHREDSPLASTMRRAFAKNAGVLPKNRTNRRKARQASDRLAANPCKIGRILETRGESSQGSAFRRSTRRVLESSVESS
jgi:methylphosphotriester-DNA--protein-cysteine methyltransferase